MYDNTARSSSWIIFFQIAAVQKAKQQYFM